MANVYLHYVLDLWAQQWRQRHATGDMIIVRFADDCVLGFEHEAEAKRFLEEMRLRLAEFSLSLHPEKTKLIEFGRFAATERERRGKDKPETFAFLGFIASQALIQRFNSALASWLTLLLHTMSRAEVEAQCGLNRMLDVYEFDKNRNTCSLWICPVGRLRGAAISARSYCC
jgi:hypothetical protein